MKLVIFVAIALLLVAQGDALRTYARARATEQAPGDESSALASPGAPSSAAPSPGAPSMSDDSAAAQPQQQDAGLNPNSINGLAGMGIAVVLRNRNHIRTIEDKSAETVEREESRKQLAEEQNRKEHQRNVQSKESELRQKMNEKQAADQQDQAESGRKLAEEQSVKKTGREEADKKDRSDESTKKKNAAAQQSQEAADKQAEQTQKKNAQQAQEGATKQKQQEQDQKSGVVKFTPFKPAQGAVVKTDIPYSGQFTYTFFVRPLQKNPPWTNILHKGSNDGERNPAVWFYPGRTMLHIRSGTRNNANEGCDTDRDHPIGEWTHVAFTHDSSGITVYFNGNQACRANVPGPLQNNGPLYVSNPWYQTASADVADLRMVDRVLSVGEIQAAANDKRSISSF